MSMIARTKIQTFEVKQKKERKKKPNYYSGE